MFEVFIASLPATCNDVSPTVRGCACGVDACGPGKSTTQDNFVGLSEPMAALPLHIIILLHHCGKRKAFGTHYQPSPSQA
ncbi:hypothetical protein RJZ90_004440 [Blastomyces dermatitidis]